MSDGHKRKHESGFDEKRKKKEQKDEAIKKIKVQLAMASPRTSPSKRGSSASGGSSSKKGNFSGKEENDDSPGCSPNSGTVGVIALPPPNQEFADFIEEHVIQFDAYRKTPTFNFQYGSCLGFGTLLIGAHEISKRLVEQMKSRGVKVVQRSCAGLGKTDFNLSFRNAMDLNPCVLVLSEYERLSSKLECLMPGKIAEMKVGGHFVPTVCVTEDKTYIVTEERSKFIRLKMLPEAE